MPDIAPRQNTPLTEYAETEEEAALLRRIELIERYMDRRFSIGGFRFGWDSVAGLVPVVGDTLTTGLSAWLVLEAHRIGAPDHVKARMMGHMAVDYVIGLVPVVGDVADAFYKANTRNVRLLRGHLEDRRRKRAAAQPAPATPESEPQQDAIR